MIFVDCACLGIDLFNTLLVVAEVKNLIKCLLDRFINALGTITSHNENTVDTTTAGLKFRNPVLLRIKALVVFGCLARRRGIHVFKLTTVEDIIVEFFRSQLFEISRCISCIAIFPVLTWARPISENDILIETK